MDLALPVAPYYRTDPQVMKDVEILRTNAASRWARDDHSRTLSRFHTTDGALTKIDSLIQPRVEILRANSPTLKRLLAARAKLERFASSISRANSPSRQSTRSTPYPRFHEKNSSTTSHPVQAPSQTLPIPPPAPPAPPPPPSAPVKTSKSSTNLARPLDKITYEKTWSLNGNLKQKCSLEIWLPKPGLDEEEDKISSRGTIPDTDKVSQAIPVISSRRSSVVKITAITTMTNSDNNKSMDDETTKKSEAIIIPRVYHYGDYIMDLPDERPRSSKSVTTVKSDSAASIKSIRRQHSRPSNRRLSTSTHHSEEILRFGTVEVPASTKTAPIQTKSASAKPTNPVLISELMQKYSLIKKNHQELTQAKIQLEKPISDSKSISSITKDQSPRSRPPPIPEPTSLFSADRSTIPVRKLLIETTPTRSISEQTPNPINAKFSERRATPHKLNHSDIYPHLRIFSLANQRQHRQSSASVQAGPLPTVSSKKIDEPPRILQRSKTLDVVLDVPTPVKTRTRVMIPPDTLLQPRSSKRSALNMRSEPQFQRSATSIPTNSLLIRYSQGNNERNYLVPE